MSICQIFGLNLLLICGGCVFNTPINPSFNVTPSQARQVLSDAIHHPRPMDRPLVIVGGLFDPDFAASGLTRDFRTYLHSDRIIGISLDFGIDEDEFRDKIIAAVDKAFPSRDPHLTTDVDVIGYSMGGVAARYAAVNPLPGRRLQIHRLFTISSPHNGALGAWRVPFRIADLQDKMTPGSDFLNALNYSSDPDSFFPIYCYVCLGDKEVGEANAAPPMQTAWWVSRPPIISSHVWAYMDSRIRADIVRRLRDETPLTTDPPAPLPMVTRG